VAFYLSMALAVFQIYQFLHSEQETESPPSEVMKGRYVAIRIARNEAVMSEVSTADVDAWNHRGTFGQRKARPNLSDGRDCLRHLAGKRCRQPSSEQDRSERHGEAGTDARTTLPDHVPADAVKADMTLALAHVDFVNE
jgi:hypothetical protein